MREYIYEVTKDADGIDCYIKRGELVRCKDCKYQGTIDCPMDEQYADDYCSYGERKEQKHG